MPMKKRPLPKGQQYQWPQIKYQPQDPVNYNPPIGLIGCGGITRDHLLAYQAAGYQVVALCDLDLDQAKLRQQEFYPAAKIYSDYTKLLNHDGLEVVDIATHPKVRGKIIEAALKAGKHVLSQKPFVLDLDEGQRLVQLAEKQGVHLAVNQNGRWAPHFSYIRQAIKQGLLGKLASFCFSVHWDHQWVAGTEFENIKHLILYDFAIHWFDALCCFMDGEPPKRVYASFTKSPKQKVRPALMAQAVVVYENTQAQFCFDGAATHGAEDRTIVRGSNATIVSVGPDCKKQQVTLHAAEGSFSPKLTGCWFPDGFHGTMGELLRAIEEDRESSISGKNNLQSLALCFAAIASAETNQPVVPGDVRKLLA